jgi:hypothetical protein
MGVAALALALASAGCLEDECTGGTSRCEGDVLQTCEESSGGPYLVERACQPGVCLAGNEGTAFCALSKAPDARCTDRSQYACDGGTLVSCHAGFATGTFDCVLGESPGQLVTLTPGTSGACVELSAGAQCVAEAEPEPDCHGTRDHFSGCNGNDHIECRYGYVLERTPCGPASCREDLTAVCSLTGEPDPECWKGDRQSSFCDGDTLVHCGWGYRISEEPCPASETCAPFSVNNARCEPRP